MVLFDKVFSSFECILLEVAFRFEVLHVLSLLNGSPDWRRNQLFFNRLQRSYVHHLSVGLFLRKFRLLKYIFIRCRNFTNKNNKILYFLHLVVRELYEWKNIILGSKTANVQESLTHVPNAAQADSASGR